MNIFRKRYSVCEVCKVHFEPVDEWDSEWANLCLTHRKEPQEKALKKRMVIDWASVNWERLYDQMLKDQKATNIEYSDPSPYGNIADILGAGAQQMRTPFFNKDGGEK